MTFRRYYLLHFRLIQDVAMTVTAAGMALLFGYLILRAGL
jgi:hypothetical protein